MLYHEGEQLNLNEAMKTHWEETGDRDPQTAAIQLLAQIPGSEFIDTLMDLLAARYADWTAKNVKPERRRVPPADPSRWRDALAIGVNYKQFYINGKPTFYRDLTPDLLRTFIGRRTGADPEVAWARANIRLMKQHRVGTCGELPDLVKKEMTAAFPAKEH